MSLPAACACGIAAPSAASASERHAAPVASLIFKFDSSTPVRDDARTTEPSRTACVRASSRMTPRTNTAPAFRPLLNIYSTSDFYASPEFSTFRLACQSKLLALRTGPKEISASVISRLVAGQKRPRLARLDTDSRTPQQARCSLQAIPAASRGRPLGDETLGVRGADAWCNSHAGTHACAAYGRDVQPRDRCP